jgi:hypothetical protein
VRVIASPEAAALVNAEGGRLYVWAEGGRCCGATKHLEAAAKLRAPGREFECVHTGEFEVFFPLGARLPGELHVAARRGRVRAYWDGCAWIT